MPPAIAPRLELWYDLASSYSYPTAMRIEALAVARNFGEQRQDAIAWACR